MTRNQIVQEARTWIDTPYRHQGRIKGVSVDCVGLIEGIGKVFGCPFEDKLAYNCKGVGTTSVIEEFSKWLDVIHPQHALPGDILGFSIHDYITIRHVAIMTPQGMIHTHALVGKVVEHALDAGWRKRIVQAFRFRGLEAV